MSASVFSILPTTPHHKHATTLCTPTKHAKLVVLHEESELSFDDIAKRSPFKHTSLHPTTLSRNYKGVKKHGGNCYWNGRKGRAGRKKKITGEELEAVIEKIDEGELHDEEDADGKCFPMSQQGRFVTPCQLA
ncbi:hypothetical protein B0H13DRAFT_2358100 [Mycena leptocephala]|nr:hypothetical protein B0H13DRAFT_2358100 [Mycena leptocephala]